MNRPDHPFHGRQLPSFHTKGLAWLVLASVATWSGCSSVRLQCATEASWKQEQGVLHVPAYKEYLLVEVGPYGRLESRIVTLPDPSRSCRLVRWWLFGGLRDVESVPGRWLAPSFGMASFLKESTFPLPLLGREVGTEATILQTSGATGPGLYEVLVTRRGVQLKRVVEFEHSVEAHGQAVTNKIELPDSLTVHLTTLGGSTNTPSVAGPSWCWGAPCGGSADTPSDSHELVIRHQVEPVRLESSGVTVPVKVELQAEKTPLTLNVQADGPPLKVRLEGPDRDDTSRDPPEDDREERPRDPKPATKPPELETVEAVLSAMGTVDEMRLTFSGRRDMLSELTVCQCGAPGPHSLCKYQESKGTDKKEVALLAHGPERPETLKGACACKERSLLPYSMEAGAGTGDDQQTRVLFKFTPPSNPNPAWQLFLIQVGIERAWLACYSAANLGK